MAKLVENTIKEFFPDNWEKWKKYVQKQGWDKDLNVLANKLKEAKYELERFFEEEDFTPENYELIKKAEKVGINRNPLGIFPMNPRLLREMIETIKNYGWKFWEIEWVTKREREEEDWDYVLIYVNDGRYFGVGREVKKLARKIADELGVEVPSVIGAIRDMFYFKELNPEELGDEVIVREGGVGRFENFCLIYCEKKDWDRVKEKLEKYAIQEIDVDEDFSPSP